MDATRSAHSLDQLTALRFVAAFGVLLSHLEFLAANAGPRAGWIYETLFRQGYCGVSFFYVLSGFILSHAYGERLATGAVTLRSYFLLRLCRIVPLHWAVAIAFVAWLATTGDGLPRPGAVAFNLTLLHAWVPDPQVHYSLNGPSWSLSDELFFYAAFPWLCRAAGRTLALCLCCGLLLVTVLASLAVGTVNEYSPVAEWLFYVAPPVRLADFVTGMLVYRLYRAGHGRFTATLSSSTWLELGVALAIPAAMMVFSLAAVPMPLRWQLAYLPLMALAVLVFAHGGGALSHLLRRRLPVLLGEASFALYLTHRPIVTLAARLWHGDPVMLATLLPPICMAVSIAVFIGFERPLLRRLRQRVAAHDRPREGLNAWPSS